MMSSKEIVRRLQRGHEIQGCIRMGGSSLSHKHWRTDYPRQRTKHFQNSKADRVKVVLQELQIIYQDACLNYYEG